ncbi:hypothetical protein D3C78_1018070 [compost metagenome]
MTSSPSAAIRCWPLKLFRARVRPAMSSCRSRPCSTPASWAPSVPRSRVSVLPVSATCKAQSPASTAARQCRCRTRSSACGSSGKWSRAARRTTSAAWRACAAPCMWMPSSVRCRRWWCATKPCAPPSPASMACRISAWPKTAACTSTGRTSAPCPPMPANNACNNWPTTRRTSRSTWSAVRCCAPAWSKPKSASTSSC